MPRILKFCVVASLCFLGAYAITATTLYCYYRRLITTQPTDVAPAPVAIVLGAGLKSDGTPSDVLRDRLRVAADLYHAGKVRYLLVSGDNSTTNYDEPTSMLNHLVNEGSVPSQVIFRDFAGRRTYDSCARAREIWGVDHAIIVTQTFHLPRALFLCAGQGIQVQGVSATLQPYVRDTYYYAREVVAFQQAMFERFVLSPRYIRGAVEQDLDPS